jgi:hypothetical protein
VRSEEKKGVVIPFPAMPSLAKPRKRRLCEAKASCGERNTTQKKRRMFDH